MGGSDDGAEWDWTGDCRVEPVGEPAKWDGDAERGQRGTGEGEYDQECFWRVLG